MRAVGLDLMQIDTYNCKNEKIAFVLGPNKKWSEMYYHIVMDFVGHLYKFKNASHSTFFLSNKDNFFNFTKEWIEISTELNNFTFDKLNWSKIRNSGYNSLFKVYCSKTVGHYKNIHSDEIIHGLAKNVIKKIKTNSTKSKFLLMKRTKRRPVGNFSELYATCLSYCKSKNLDIEVFDDSVNLGSVWDQLYKFEESKIIVGPHGAGFTNIIGCDKNTTIIELKSLCRTTPPLNKKDGSMYEEMSKRIGLKYHKLYNDQQNFVNVHKLKTILEDIK